MDSHLFGRFARALFLFLGLVLVGQPCVAAEQAAGAAPAAGAPVVAIDARLTQSGPQTTLSVTLAGASKTMSVSAFVLDNPRRVVVDLPAIAFRLSPDVGTKGQGLVKAWRFGSIGPAQSRIVLDLAQPAHVARAFVLEGAEGLPPSLVVDLDRTNETTFRKDVMSARQRPLQEETGSLPPAAAPPSGKSELPLVVIDPGHGGIDTGAVAQDTFEKDIVLGFARKLAAKIEATGKFRVMLTRSDDTFVTLANRVTFARENQAKLFISIHADTLPDPMRVRGATVYTLSDRASDAASARYAEKENQADAIAGVDLSTQPSEVADILIDLTRRETRTFSNAFARSLITRFGKAAALNKNPHRSAGFVVLKAPDVPSVLLELGYMSNRRDIALLTSTAWQDRATGAMVEAVKSFFDHTAAATAGIAP